MKTRTTSLDAFESINYPYVGMVANGRCYSLIAPEPETEFSYSDALDPRADAAQPLRGNHGNRQLKAGISRRSSALLP